MFKTRLSRSNYRDTGLFARLLEFHGRKVALKYRLIPTNRSSRRRRGECEYGRENEKGEQEGQAGQRWVEIAWDRMEWVPTRRRNNLIYPRIHDYTPSPLKRGDKSWRYRARINKSLSPFVKFVNRSIQKRNAEKWFLRVSCDYDNYDIENR